jgi:glycosyl transferase family 25
MKIKVLTLEGEGERQRNIAEQLDALGLTFEFFFGVDGRAGCHPLFERYNPVKRLRIKGEPLLAGQLGCFASHFLLWQACVGEQEPVIILEDDAIIDSKKFPDFLLHAQNADRQFECIRLFRNNSKRHQAIRAGRIGNLEVYRYTKGPMSTMGYYLAPGAAKKFLQAANEWVLPVDIFMDQFWKNDVECYGVLPPVVSHNDDVKSMIDYVPKDKKAKRSPRTRLNREIYALMQVLGKWCWDLRYRMRKSV